MPVPHSRTRTKWAQSTALPTPLRKWCSSTRKHPRFRSKPTAWTSRQASPSRTKCLMTLWMPLLRTICGGLGCCCSICSQEHRCGMRTRKITYPITCYSS
eukprot:Lithocolla_globosa_v1_NODE_1525_length_2514_cov_2.477023.p2 type:complete len:100 gc:universal NODE_1525_length_2514_cov_2.477023:1358-1059(-)